MKTVGTEHIPNLFTGLRLLTGLITFVLIIQAAYPLALLTFLIATLTDPVDGWLARRLDAASTFGRVFDRHVDFLILAGAMTLVILSGRTPLFAVLLLIPVAGAVLAASAIALRHGTGYLYETYYHRDGGLPRKLTGAGSYTFVLAALAGIMVYEATLVIIGFELGLYLILLHDLVPELRA